MDDIHGMFGTDPSFIVLSPRFPYATFVDFRELLVATWRMLNRWLSVSETDWEWLSY